MNATGAPPPQRTGLYRLIELRMRLQLEHILGTTKCPRLVIIPFVLVAGIIALGIIMIGARFTGIPFLIPLLAPSAFILFHSPLGNRASPRTVILSHVLAVAAGLISFWLVAAIFPQSGTLILTVLNWPRVLAIALGVGLASAMMVVWRCAHPPAVASSLLAAMGYLNHPTQALGLLGTVVLLVLEAFILIRLVGGFPYPIWRSDRKEGWSYGPEAGVPEVQFSFWQQLELRLLQRRKP